MHKLCAYYLASTVVGDASEDTVHLSLDAPSTLAEILGVQRCFQIFAQ